MRAPVAATATGKWSKIHRTVDSFTKAGAAGDGPKLPHHPRPLVIGLLSFQAVFNESGF